MSKQNQKLIDKVLREFQETYLVLGRRNCSTKRSNFVPILGCTFSIFPGPQTFYFRLCLYALTKHTYISICTYNFELVLI